jgi:CubicO group peptidase (beta-lactamase class C family)
MNVIMRNLIISFFLILIGFNSYSQEYNFSDKLIDSTIINFQNKWEIPGISVAIAKDGRLIYAKGFGYADTLKKEPVTPNSLFRIASCSKTITALGILKLIEEKKLNLNDKVFGYDGILYDSLYRNIADDRVYSITVRNLLQHTAGWIDLDIIGGNDASYALNLPIPAGKEANIKYMLLQKLDFSPSTQYRYSNFNYLFLGEIINKISGKSYEEYIQSEILNPIGVKTTFPAKSKIEERATNEVIYYDYNGEKCPSAFDTTEIVPQSYSDNMTPKHPEGGWVSRPIDMLKIILAFDRLDKPVDLLKKETINTMTTPPDDIKSKYAMGVKVADNMWFHTGALTWGTFAMWFKTSDNVCFTITCNTLPNTGENDEEKLETLGLFYKDVFNTFPVEIKKIKNYPDINLFENKE